MKNAWLWLVDHLNKKRQESFSFLGFWVTLMLLYPTYYLLDLMVMFTDRLYLSPTSAATYVNISDALTSLFGLMGATVLGSYLTSYGMIFFSSLPYLFGLIILAVNPFKPATVGIGLGLIAVGKSSLINSTDDLRNRSKSSPTAVKIIEFVARILVVVLMAVVFPPESYAARVSFVVSAVTTALVPLVTLFYVKLESFVKPIDKRGPSLSHFPRVFIASIFIKRKLSSVSPKHLYQDEEAPQQEQLEHTNGRLSWLDKAAIKEPGNKRSKWLSSVTQVEECKILMRTFLICPAFLLYGMVHSIGNTYFLDQTNKMNTNIGGLEFPPAAFLYMSDWSSSLSNMLYTLWIRKGFGGRAVQLASTVRCAMGLVMYVLCCTTASWVAMEVYQSHDLKSVLWLTPQFITFGVTKGITRGGIEEFYSEQLPPSLKRCARMFADANIGVGSLLATLLVLILKHATKWFPDEPENNQLEKFYHLLTVLGIAIFFLFSFLAVSYHYRDDKANQHGNSTAEESNFTIQQDGNVQVAEHKVTIYVQNRHQEEQQAADNFTEEPEQEKDQPGETNDELQELIQKRPDSVDHVGLKRRRMNRLWTF